MTTSNPRSLSRLIAPAAPASSFTFAASCRKPVSSTIVPSRSRKTARLLTQCGDDRVYLVWKNGARVEQHSIPREARDDRWIVRAQSREIGVGSLVLDAEQPRLQFRARE